MTRPDPKKLLILLTLLLAACGGTSDSQAPQAPEPAASAADAAPGSEPATAEPVKLAEGQVRRADLNLLLDAGVAMFLRRVPIEADRPKGKYRGFRILTIDGRPKAEGMNIQAGDVVTTVNGMPIERPEQLARIWEELRVASEIRIEFLRNDQPMLERLEIVEK